MSKENEPQSDKVVNVTTVGVPSMIVQFIAFSDAIIKIGSKK